MGLMERFFGFSWGVHPEDHKRPAADVPARHMPMPEHLYISLAQHLGAPALPAALVGQRVRKGELLAHPQGPVSAAIHAPTSGVIVAIGEIPAPHPSGLPVLAVTLAADGLDAWTDLEPCADPFALDPEEINHRVAQAGVVGMGGATFPSALKLSGSKKAGVATLILNGGECEPYLSCDDRLMRDAAADIVDGIRIMLHATGAREALVGIEENKPEAILSMREAAAAFGEVRVCPVPARYPMGSEKQLALVLTGKEIPAGRLPADIGVVVHNVGTAKAVSEAIRLGRPLITRLLTVNGSMVNAPGNILAPVGALVEDVLRFAGGLAGTPTRLVMGGPMMGLSLPHPRVPVVKGTSGILALSAAEAAESAPAPCIRCASCVRACPVGLLPLEMARHIAAEDLEGAVDLGLKDCIACGCCAYVCPARIPLVQYFGHAKGSLAAEERARMRTEATRKMAEARKTRLEAEAREKAEAAARRKAERAAKAALEKAKAEAEAASSQTASQDAPQTTPQAAQTEGSSAS
ncbi:MAG: electron transport complex subunit RsxC [Zoogloeaceae bacterium]|jgi:electron transport complex protein RnfC|nr:electron transport complex subunit RsxC [Zoogloeaceae bacterium]